MAQHDLNIANQSFPSFRSDLNNALSAIQTTHSGTSRPTGAVAGQIWLDTTSATSPTLKYYDGADDISLATIDHSANTVNWLDSTVSITGLTTTATGTVLTLTDTHLNSTVSIRIPTTKGIDDDSGNEFLKFTKTASAVNEFTIINSATGSAPEIQSTGGDTNIDLKITPKGSGKIILDGLAFPNADGTANQVLQTNGSGVLSFASASADYVLLATTTASSAASVSFDGYFSSTYTNYEVIISDVRPASANEKLVCRFRRSNADVTASNYSSAGRRTHQIAGGSDVNDGRYASNASQIDILTNSQPASASRTLGSKIIIYNPLSTTSYKKVNFQSVGGSDDGGGTNGIWNVNLYSQLTDNTNALSGISFYYTSGNISEGIFKLYGIK